MWPGPSFESLRRVEGPYDTLAGHYVLLGDDYQLAVRKTRGFEQGQLGHDT